LREDAHKRAQRAVALLRADGAEQHLIDALERSKEELTNVARRLRQGTFFAGPRGAVQFPMRTVTVE
jgi:hypothetical protein